MSKAEKTRQYIIERVSPIFNKYGYAGTSLSQIIEAIGLTKGAVYGNFKSKEEIALEALQHNFDLISTAVGKKIKEHYDACDRLLAIASYYDDNYEKIAKIGGCPLLNAAAENDDGNPLLRKKVIEFIDYWQYSLKRIIELGIERRQITKKVDIDHFSSLFIETIEGGLMLAKVTGKREYIERAVQNIKDIINMELRI